MIGVVNVLSFMKDSVFNFGKNLIPIPLDKDPKAVRKEIERLCEEFKNTQETKQSDEPENEQFYDAKNDNAAENCHKKSGNYSSHFDEIRSRRVGGR